MCKLIICISAMYSVFSCYYSLINVHYYADYAELILLMYALLCNVQYFALYVCYVVPVCYYRYVRYIVYTNLVAYIVDEKNFMTTYSYNFLLLMIQKFSMNLIGSQLIQRS